MPNSCGPAFFNPGLEYFVWGFRGIKGTSLDLRRKKQEIKEAIAIIDDFYLPQYEAAAKAITPEDPHFFDCSSCPMGHTILSSKQFEEFYWPSYKKHFDITVENGLTNQMFAEGSFANKMEFFQDIPAGHLCTFLESDDPFETHKTLPNVVIAGGSPTSVLANGTKEECIDTAKKFVDELGSEGNYIYAINKMISFPNDVKAENLLAVNEYMKECKLS